MTPIDHGDRTPESRFGDALRAAGDEATSISGRGSAQDHGGEDQRGDDQRGDDQGAGEQIGPFMPRPPRDETVLVPKRPDKWAHRRGEPRVYAFFWTLYLLGATLMGFMALGLVGGITAEVYRPVARGIIITVMVGAVILWPMTRLSQVVPTRGGARAVRADMIVMLVPLQAVVWPQAILPAGWTPLSIGALAAMSAAWTIFVGGLLAIALGGPRLDHPARRPAARAGWVWMAMLVLVMGAAPLASLLTWRDNPDIRTEWLLSPISGVFELTRNRVHTSLAPDMTALHWGIIALPAVLGVVFWFIAAARDARVARQLAMGTAGRA